MRLAVASLLGSNVPALVESATALRRDVARAGGQRLQVVRIACLAARVRRDAAGVHASFHNSAIAERAAQRRERWPAERERAVLAEGTTSHNVATHVF